MTRSTKLAPLIVLVTTVSYAAPVPDPLRQLLDGNRRFAAGHAEARHRDATRRDAVANAQQPFAVVVGCADSRVPPELVFDQGLGDMFVVRAAGEVLDTVGLGSVEFAVTNLGARLIVVLGHERCGAVQAAYSRAEASGSLALVVDTIRKNLATDAAASDLDGAIATQVRSTMLQLSSQSATLAPMVRDGRVVVAGAVYDLDTGLVHVLPAQEAPRP